MSKLITFEGSSDDLIEINDNGKELEYYASNDTIKASFLIDYVDWYRDDDYDEYEIHQRMVVHSLYENACWCFAPALCDEDDHFPLWPIYIKDSGAYSTRLEIHVDDLATLERVDK